MSGDRVRVVIVPCSGIGKTYGTVSREAAFQLTESVRPDSTQLIPLSLLVLGEEKAKAALAHGLPPCSGVALGVDRLLMLVTGATDIREVLAFDWAHA